MVSSYSTDLKLELMVTGENAGTWGDITNTNLVILQQAIAGYQSISIAGGAQTTALAMSNATLSNARNAVIELTGTITGNQIVTVPDGIEKTWTIFNNTTGAFTVQFKTVSGTGPTFGTTDKSTRVFYSNGTNVIDTLIDTTNGVNTLSNKTLASPIITTAATVNAQGELRLADSDSSNYVGFKSGATVTTNTVWTLPTADGTNGQALTTNGSGTLSWASAGLAWQAVQTSGFTAVAGRAYPCNTTSSAFTVTLPSSASTGDQIAFVDYAGTFATNALTLSPNGLNINGQTGSRILNTNREGVIITYIDATQGWVASTGVNEGTVALSPPPYSIDFLVVAGGGAGGGMYVGGGGGAGGFRTSTQTASVGVPITVTVGDGGTGNAQAGATRSTAGTASSISGTGLTSISSAGGGYGGQDQTPFGNGDPGGSGGGAAGGGTGGGGPGGSGNTPSVSPSQGNNGGNGSTPLGAGGGGGGATSAGTSAAPGQGGPGGNGTASSITGSSITYAGGGGANCTGGTSGAGGTGGGGAGGTNVAGTAGTANLGGGGGGTDSRPGPNAGGNGGKGVVILSVPTASYSGTTTGSPTITTSGSNTIIKFTGSGSYTT